MSTIARLFVKLVGSVFFVAFLGLLPALSQPGVLGQKKTPKFCIEKSETGFGASGLAFWKKSVLKVRFMDGSDFVRTKVKQYASEWTKYANIKFKFFDGDKFADSDVADIRISFTYDKGSWSYVGTLQPSNQNKPTMNFGWFNETTKDEEFRRVTLHEFGHALGLIHEHQSSEAKIKWNKEKVYEDYLRTQDGWTKADIDRNVFNRYDETRLQYTQYDPTSIMQYSIPKEHLLEGGIPVGWNSELSELDKLFIASVYPNLKVSVHKVSGTNQWGTAINPVKTKLEVKTGEKYGVRIVAPYDSFAYILGYSQEGTYLIFPNLPTHEDTKLLANKEKRFRFTMTGNVGAGELIIILSPIKIKTQALTKLLSGISERKITNPPTALPSVSGIGAISNLSCGYAEQWFGDIFNISCLPKQQSVEFLTDKTENVTVKNTLSDGKLVFRISYQHIPK